MSGIGTQNAANIPVSYLVGYIFLSYVISSMGCATTLELLRRRTSRSGFYNWYLLLTSSITMGGIGIWCMHFIGNQAIVLGNGEQEIQILYNVAFTGTSFVLPVIVLLTAFYSVGVEEKAGYLRILHGGLLTGSSVCGMHYVGQLGIANYRCSYAVASVVGSAIIAVFSSTVALGIFFRWRASWTDSWWRRGICACCLSAAVSGMHWTAAVGTSYEDRNESITHGTQSSRSHVVIICAVLACVSCVILSACAIVAGSNRRRSATRAHQLVLACAYFDSAGRVMVTPQALLPTRKIVDHYIGRTFKDDDFTRIHPAFLWAFKASCNWPMVKAFIPFMRNRLESEQQAIQKHVLSHGVIMNKETELQTDFDTLFKQLFCVTAQDLSDDLRQPLSDLGTLYDDVLSTAIPDSRGLRAIGRSSRGASKGQLIFSVRQLQKHEVNRFTSAGFRFATIEHVISPLSRRIHVPKITLLDRLYDMRDYASSRRGFGEGVHLIFYVMRPTFQDHFEILTTKGTGNPLPSCTLPIKRLSVQHLDLISHMEGRSMIACLKYLQSKAVQQTDKNMEEFCQHLVQGITSLAKSFPEEMCSAAKFSSRPILAPCRTALRQSEESHAHAPQCTLLTFCVIAPLDTEEPTPDFTFTPFRLFRVQQQVNDAITDRDGFLRELNQEFFVTDVRPNSVTESDIMSSTRSAILKLWALRKHFAPLASAHTQGETVLGDITVQKEVRVDVTRIEDIAAQNVAHVHDAVIAARGAITTPATYVDELYVTNVTFWREQRRSEDIGIASGVAIHGCPL